MPDVTETAQAQVQRLAENWNWPDPAILEDILALGPEAIPAIEERLTPEFFRRVQLEDRENTFLFYLIHVLADLRDPAAIPILAGLYNQVEEDDDLIEDIPEALLALGPEAIGPLLEVASNARLGWFARASAAETAVDLAAGDPARRAQIAAVLRSALTGYLTQEEPPEDDVRDLIASFCSDLARLADPEARPLIEAVFDAELVGHRPTGERFMDIPLIDREEVAELYAEGGRSDFRTYQPYLERYRRDYREHGEEQEKKARLALLNSKTPPQPIVLEPKLGRNDPCWCGSGQKYKKCHLAQDEKEKVRL